MTHSGLQLGADPIIFGRHEHTAAPFMSLHWELGPHGDGTQGLSTGLGSGGGAEIYLDENKFEKYFSLSYVVRGSILRKDLQSYLLYSYRLDCDI